MPHEQLASLFLTIEYATAKTLNTHKRLQDKDIEWVFVQYRNYFQQIRQGKDPADPNSTRTDRMALMDNIWEGLLLWEEAEGHVPLLDGAFRPGGRPVTMVEELYVMAFNDLRKSCRLHRKQDGARGYVKYVREFVASVLADDPSLVEMLEPDLYKMTALDFSHLLDKRGYQIDPDISSNEEPAIAAIIEQEDTTLEQLEALLVKFPNNAMLKAEYAHALNSYDRAREAIAIMKELVITAPRNPYFVSTYLSFLFDEDIDEGFAEAERLDFKFELTDYDLDNATGYSVTSLLAHSVVCIRMAAMGKDHDYYLELLDDLAKTNLPEELIVSIGRHIILEVIPKDSEDDEAERHITHFIEEWSDKYPQAIGILTRIMDLLLSALLDDLLPESRSNYPAAIGQHSPWPRNPGNVDEALQLRVNIIGSDPEIYRVIVVPDDTLLPDLHGILQVAFDWEQAHLYEFVHQGKHYQAQEFGSDYADVDASSIRIGQLLKTVGDELLYRYDFGDDWQHRIVLEAIPLVDDEILYPRCLAGARRGPAEDSGGIHHYQHILKVLKDPQHEQYEEFKEWLPEDFDPDEFVLAWTHKQLWKGRFWNMGWGNELDEQ